MIFYRIPHRFNLFFLNRLTAFFLTILICLAIVPPLKAQPGQSVVPFNIPAGDLDACLNTLAVQADITLSFAPELVTDRSSKGLSGRITLEQALERLLQGTGIVHRFLSESTVILEQGKDLSGNEYDLRTVNLADLLVTVIYRNTATKSALTPEETPQGITVIDRELLEMRGADSINDALRYVTGVHSELRGGAVTRMDQFTIRGFQNYQNCYDGLQLLYNDWNLQPQVDAFAVEQVEVFKGPTSVLYGNMPPGGLVNLIAKSPSNDPLHRIRFSTGTHAFKEAGFEFKGPIADAENVSYSLVGLGRKKDGQAATSEEERYLFAPSVEWQATDRTLVNFNIYYQKDPSAGIYNTLPAIGTVLPSTYGELSADAFGGDANWNTFNREVAMAGFKIDHNFSEHFEFFHNLRYIDADMYQENTYNTGCDHDGQILNRRAYLTDEKSRGLVFDNQFTLKFDTAEIKHNLLFGQDYLFLDSDIIYEDALAPSINLYSPDHYLINRSTLDFVASGYSSEFNIEKKQIGFYIQDQIRWGRLILMAGGRHDCYEQTETGIKYGASVNNKTDQDNLAFRYGLLYELGYGFSPYLSYAESFEPVAGSDRHGNKFDPSTAFQYEGGIKFEGMEKRLKFTFSAFQIIKENDLTRDPNGTAYDQIQTGETRSRGFEFDLSFHATSNLSLFCNLTQIDMEITSDNNGLEGKTPIWVPDQTASVWVDYRMPAGIFRGVDLGLGVRYVGKTMLDAANTQTVPDYTLMDLSLSYNLGALGPAWSGMNIMLLVTNLFDKHYYSAYDQTNVWFGEERVVKFGFEYEF